MFTLSLACMVLAAFIVVDVGIYITVYDRLVGYSCHVKLQWLR